MADPTAQGAEARKAAQRLKLYMFGASSLVMPSVLPSLPPPPLSSPMLATLNSGKYVQDEGLPSPLQSLPLMESCITRGAFAVVGGYLMGLFFGAAFASFGTMSALDGAPAGYDPSKVTPVQAVRPTLWSSLVSNVFMLLFHMCVCVVVPGAP